MLTPFTALLPRHSGVEHWALERAAKALRLDPARYQSIEGVEYRRTEPSLYRWEAETAHGTVVGLVGLFPLDALQPHEATKPNAHRRPQHPVQIRPVMGLIDAPLPHMEPVGETIHFSGYDHHTITPVLAPDLDVPSAVIADGHHRVAAALRTGVHREIMTVLVSAEDAAFTAGAFHRVFSGSAPLPDRIPGCDVVLEPPRQAVHEGRIVVVTPDATIGVTVTDPESAAYQGLPAGLAARYLLPALGRDEAEARYVDDIRTALTAVDEGGTAVLLPGSDLAAVIRAAQSQTSLPPKSTRFRPKPVRGLVMRPLA